MNDAVKKADEKLRDAILESIDARGYNNSESILADYIIIGHQVGFDSNGDTTSSYCYLLSNDSLPYHTIFGLLKTAEYFWMNSNSTE